MKDGLYQVTLPYLCAGFTVKNGTLEFCAPILRSHYTRRGIKSWVFKRGVKI